MIAENIMEFEESKLQQLEKEDKAVKQFNYQKWFMNKCEQFTEVDIVESQKVSKTVDAQVKECYKNTWKAVWNSSMRYFEGFVWTRSLPIPIQHSWLVKDGKVIDPTFAIPMCRRRKQMMEKYGVEAPERTEVPRFGDEYVGVQIPTSDLNKMVFKTKRTGDFLIDYYIAKELDK